MNTIAAITLALKLSTVTGMAPLPVTATAMIPEVTKGEACILSWAESSCFPIGKGQPRVTTRKYVLREPTSFALIISYWDEQEKKWKTMQTRTQTVQVVER